MGPRPFSLLLAFLLVCLPAFLLLGACSARVEAPFDPKAGAFIHERGTAAIEGEVFLTRDYARLVRGAGERVYLIPETPYTRERFAALFRGAPAARWAPAIEDTPQAYFDQRRMTKADSRGQFSFENLAPGRYIVASPVTWTEPYMWIPKGAAVWDTVTVEPGGRARVILSGK